MLDVDKVPLWAAVSPTASIISLAAVVWFHGVNEHSAFPTTGTVSVLFVLVLGSVRPLLVLSDRSRAPGLMSVGMIRW